jgi:excisionase family DNA binding protein
MLKFSYFRNHNAHFPQKKEPRGVEDIITASQVAELLHIHVRTVYRLTEEGVIPGSRIGRSWRFNKKDILDLVSARQEKNIDFELNPNTPKASSS